MIVPSPADAPVRVETTAGRGWAVRGFDEALLKRLVTADECPDADAEVMKAGNTAVVLRGELLIAGKAVPVCWKRIRRKTWLKRLATSVRTRRTVLTYLYAARLLEAGVGTPRGVACTAPAWWRIDRPAWLLTDWIEGTEDLAIADRRLAEASADERLRTAGRYAAAVGETLGRLHAAGATHRDLKPNNLLVFKAEPTEGDPTKAWVIDLDAVSFPNRLSDHRRRRDVARLHRGLSDMPRTVAVRFFKAYAEARGTLWREEWDALTPPVD
ncbi:MAG: lipopolysaccharide kinase InaA family protein [Planctomycetota bacterium]